MKEYSHFRNILILVVLSYFMLMFGNSIMTLTNPDEVFYTQTAKEMVHHNTWLVPYLFDHPQFEKPIFTYWMLRVAFIIFGITNFSARFFPALFGIIGVLGAYFLAFLGFKDKKRAFTSALVLLSAGIYVGMARTVFTDMIFSVLVFLSLVFFFWAYSNPNRKSGGIILAFIFMGLAVLAKGPLGFIIPIAVIALFLALKRDLKFMLNGYSLFGFILGAAICLPWYIYVIKIYGHTFTHEFFYNDHYRRLISAEHKANDTWYFYPLSMLLGMAPWFLFVLAAFFYLAKRIIAKDIRPIYLFLASYIAAVFLIFQFAHSKLISYILPMFPALALITGDYICTCVLAKRKSLGILASVSLVLFFCFPIALLVASNKYSEYISSKEPVYEAIILFSAVLLIMLYLLIKRKWLAYIYLFPVLLGSILVFTFKSHNYYEPFVSSKRICEYLLKNHKVDNAILCSKMFIRGVRFYTDKEVAFVNLRGSDFFSPHPVLHLESEEAIFDFLKKQGTSYCIVRKSFIDDFQRFLRPQDKLELLKAEGDAYLIRVKVGE